MPALRSSPLQVSIERQLGAKLAEKSEPKLLKHGGKRDGQGSNDNLGRGKDYTIARLERDGHSDLLFKVKSGSISAAKAAIEAGFKAPESPLTILKRVWKKASVGITDSEQNQ